MNRLYDFVCTACGHEWEELFFRVSTVPCAIPCEKCNGFSKRKFPKLHIRMGVGAYGYYDETLGTYINTNRQKEDIMREQGVTLKGDTPKNEQAWV